MRTQTPSLPFSDNHTLINFNIPTYLKRNFDNLVKFKRVSRTSILNQLIDRYVRFELDQIENEDRINLLMLDIEKRNQNSLKNQIKKTIGEMNDDNGPPAVPYQTDEIVSTGWTKKRRWEDGY